MSKPSISFLVHDIACPVLGPVTVLARILEDHFPVQIVGPDFGHGVCPMYKEAFPYTVVPTPHLYRLPDYLWERKRLSDAVTGDIIVSVKAYANTLPVALGEKRRRGARVVAYLDEWDGALFHRLSSIDKLKYTLRHAHHPLEDLYYPWVERMMPRADEVISTTTSLQRKFGGRIVHMGVDTDLFSPQPEDVILRRKQELGLNGQKLIVFGGVVRPHKGIEQIADALVELARPDVKLLVVGPDTVHLQEMCKDPVRGPYVVAAGPRAKAEMPDFLALANAVALPLVDDPLAQSQMPCKVFEAMAMGVPVIASDVSDLPQVLEGCGWVVPPGDVKGLADRMAWVVDHPEEACAMGQAARRKCIATYSKEVTEQELLQIIERLSQAHPTRGSSS